MAKYKIGIDLGGTNIAAGIVDENYNIIIKGSVPTKAERDPEEIIKDMGKLCNDLLAEAKLTVKDIKCAGIASPGSVNPLTGVVLYSNNLPFVKFPIAAILKKYLAVDEVFLENDANAAAKGEAVAGAAKGCNHAIMITLGTGLGGGVIIDKKVYSGFNYAGAELGHMVIEYNGRQCTCGRKGCWEAYSAATGLINMTKEKLAVTKESDTVMHKMVAENNGEVSGKTAFAAARQGDKAGQEVVKQYIDYLACGVSTIINIFQPEVLCIGGGVCKEGDFLTKPLMEIVNKEQYTRDNASKTQVKIAALGNDAGIIGAAFLDE